MSLLFTADQHLGHYGLFERGRPGIIEYCDRPFSSTEEMDQTMIDHWNFAVRPEDTLIHLGDLAFGNTEKVRRYLSQLNGKILLILGNHDRKRQAFFEHGIRPKKSALLFLPDGRSVFLQHRPATDRNQWRGASLHLCGHIHQCQHPNPQIINVGVDVWNFAPVASEVVLGVAIEEEVVLR